MAPSWHPMSVNSAIKEAYLSNNSTMNVGANYLREHVIDKARIHNTITNAGGAPNIIPKEANHGVLLEHLIGKMFKR